jgi:parvulin-like peptidyl-prolyl isomerase
MKKWLALLLAAFGVITQAQGEERAAEATLVVREGLSLTTTDFQAYLDKVPEKIRTEFAAEDQRVKRTIDALWIQRVVAERAREEGYAKDPIIAAKLRQAYDAVLWEEYMRRIEKDARFPDLLPRAREVYAARKGEFKVPERVHVLHVLVDPQKCRKPDEALRKAHELRAQIVAGKEHFADIAKRESDDPKAAQNGGDLGLVAITEFDEAFRKGIATLKPGDVSQPIETKFGFHVVRLLKREPERQKTFDEVKDDLIAAEKAKIIDEARGQVLLQVRNDPKTTLDLKAIEALIDRNRAALPLPQTKPN